MFELLKANYKAYQEATKAKKADFIRNGLEGEADRGLRFYSTDTRWNQYTNGKITRAKAVEYAINRNNKAIDRETAAEIDFIDYVAAAPDITFIRVEIEWRKSSVWGWNPYADVSTNGSFSRFTGSASGCGYDKRSAAVAEAFKKCPEVMKILFNLEEEMLKTGNNNRREIIGYGSGYGSLPYFEGGVGVDCFWHILKKAGFECNADGGKTWDIYRLEKVNK